MHAVVFVKQVPQQNSVKITADKQIDTSGIEPIISLFDEYAIGEALLQVEKSGGKVTVVTIGGEEQIDALRKALAMGADQAMLVNDPALKEICSLGVAKVAAAVVKKLGDADRSGDKLRLKPNKPVAAARLYADRCHQFPSA